MSNGEKSNLPENGENLTEVRINPVDAIVKKIVMWGDPDDHELAGVQFFDEDNNKILEAGIIEFKKRELILEEA